MSKIEASSAPEFPSARYQGNKKDILDFVWDTISDFSFNSILDVFGGTGVVSYKAKKEGKRVYYNDFLLFNHQVGLALIQNDGTTLSNKEVDELLSFEEDWEYPTTIQDEFDGLYFKEEENVWLDKMKLNIEKKLSDKYKKAIAYSAISQAALVKRPYNLFHRANLYMRTQDVERSFGNKKTWETDFEEFFRRFVSEFNNAVFDNGWDNMAFNRDVFDWEPPEVDLIYMDPPYFDGDRGTYYKEYYHFLEGYLQYDSWSNMINEEVKTKRIKHDPSPWNSRDGVKAAYQNLFEKFSDEKIVLSYNEDCYPSPSEIKNTLEKYKDIVGENRIDNKYALSDEQTEEIVFTAYDK